MIQERRPDIFLIKKTDKECLIIDITIPVYTRAWYKEEEKIQKCGDLPWELKGIWKVKTRVIPIVIGALWIVRTGHKVLNCHFKTSRKQSSLNSVQMYILGKALHVYIAVVN